LKSSGSTAELESVDPTTRSLASEGPVSAAEIANSGPNPAEDRPRRSSESSNGDGDSSLKRYLAEIGKVKLLTPEEEVALAKRI
jgi:DNA-directed RNA polymerase sigma subunit (sigma70/sigma32)